MASCDIHSVWQVQKIGAFLSNLQRCSVLCIAGLFQPWTCAGIRPWLGMRCCESNLPKPQPDGFGETRPASSGLVNLDPPAVLSAFGSVSFFPSSYGCVELRAAHMRFTVLTRASESRAVCSSVHILRARDWALNSSMFRMLWYQKQQNHPNKVPRQKSPNMAFCQAKANGLGILSCPQRQL